MRKIALQVQAIIGRNPSKAEDFRLFGSAALLTNNG
jgi:hypothetical protein